MVVSLPPIVGVKDAIPGSNVKIKPAFETVVTGVVTDTFPEAPEATIAVMLVAEFIVNELASTSPKLTAVAPVKLTPVTFIAEPTPPEVGIKLLIIGVLGGKLNCCFLTSVSETPFVLVTINLILSSGLKIL